MRTTQTGMAVMSRSLSRRRIAGVLKAAFNARPCSAHGVLHALRGMFVCICICMCMSLPTKRFVGRVCLCVRHDRSPPPPPRLCWSHGNVTVMVM